MRFAKSSFEKMIIWAKEQAPQGMDRYFQVQLFRYLEWNAISVLATESAKYAYDIIGQSTP